MKTILTTTSNSIEGGRIISYLDVVNANIVIGNNVFSEMFASFSDFFGGRSGKYQNKLDSLYQYAIKELREKAAALGANAIIGMKMDFSNITGKGKDMFMLAAVGTAVKVDGLSPELCGEVKVLTDREREQAEQKKAQAASQKSIVDTERSSQTARAVYDKNALYGQVQSILNESGRREAINFLKSTGMEFQQAISYLSNYFPE